MSGATGGAARRLLAAGALLFALATAVGAYAAHVLQGSWDGARYATVQTAVQYQFLHALGVVLLGALAEWRARRALALAGWCATLGIVLFCGSLYLLAAGAPRWVAYFTPLGGASLIGAWVAAAVLLWRGPPAR